MRRVGSQRVARLGGPQFSLGEGQAIKVEWGGADQGAQMPEANGTLVRVKSEGSWAGR